MSQYKPIKTLMEVRLSSNEINEEATSQLYRKLRRSLMYATHNILLLDTKYAFICEVISTGIISLSYIPKKLQTASPNPITTHYNFVSVLGLMS